MDLTVDSSGRLPLPTGDRILVVGSTIAQARTAAQESLRRFYRDARVMFLDFTGHILNTTEDRSSGPSNTFYTAPTMESSVRQAGEEPRRFGMDLFFPARIRIIQLRQGALLPQTVEGGPSASLVTPPSATGTTGDSSNSPGGAPLPSTTGPAPLPPALPPAALTGNTPGTNAGGAPSAEDAAQLFTGTGRSQVLPNYVLARGDKITLRYRSAVMEERTTDLTVDTLGRVSLPSGARIVAAGLTLQQFESAAQTAMRRYFRDVLVTAELAELHNIRVFVTGEAFQPGPQIVPATTTLFSLLYLVGGPSDAGSLRGIRLMRGKTSQTIDLYRYLINGDSSQDRPLQDGDTVLIPLVGKSVTVRGAVRRPAIFELLPTENLEKALVFAGKLAPSARADRVQVRTVVPNEGPTLKDVDLTHPNVLSQTPLRDGDVVLVSSVREEPINVVSVTGMVELPGAFSYREGMRISDLIGQARGLRGEVYMDRAELYRMNEDRTTTLIPINLKNAMAGDATANLALQRQDRLVIHSLEEMQWVADRVVEVQGAVQRPGRYARPDKEGGFRLWDLVMLSGGLLPDAAPGQAVIQRPSFSADPPKLIYVDLMRASHDDPDQNLVLQGGDSVRVYAKEEVAYTPERSVRIMGAVQRPGLYPRTEKMMLKDLLFLAGGLTPQAAQTAEVAIPQPDNRPKVLNVDLVSLMGPDGSTGETQNAEMVDGSVVTVPTVNSSQMVVRTVYLEGAVERPGPYALKQQNEKISDVVTRAGGFAKDAFPGGARLVRVRDRLLFTGQQDQLNAMAALLDKDNLDLYTRLRGRAVAEERLNNQGRQGASLVPIPTGNDSSSTTNALTASALSSATNNQGTQTVTQTSMADLEHLASLLVSQPESLQLVQQSEVVGLDLASAVNSPRQQSNIRLEDGDRIIVPVMPTTVTVYGAVVQPGSQRYVANHKVADWIQDAGGYRENANRKKLLVAHLNGRVEVATDRMKLMPGDIVVVPNTVQAVRPAAAREKSQRNQETITSTLLSVGMLRLLLGL
jgi:protein involved in polysaccharide export with SLBB domain